MFALLCVHVVRLAMRDERETRGQRLAGRGQKESCVLCLTQYLCTAVPTVPIQIVPGMKQRRDLSPGLPIDSQGDAEKCRRRRDQERIVLLILQLLLTAAFDEPLFATRASFPRTERGKPL